MKAKTRTDHAVIQKLIIISLGILTYSIMLTSCTTASPCSAYDNVEIEQVDKK